jgi:hypothetical protein
MEKPLMHMTKSKANLEKAACRMTSTTHLGKGKTMVKVKRSVFAKVERRGGRNEGGAQRSFRVIKICSMIDGCMSVYICQSHRMYKYKSKA